MNKMAAANLAGQLTKAFIEHQVIASPKVDPKVRGEECGEVISALHRHLTAYFQKLDDGE